MAVNLVESMGEAKVGSSAACWECNLAERDCLTVYWRVYLAYYWAELTDSLME